MVYLHNTYSISAELFINLIQKLFSFSVLGVALTILEPLGPTSPHDHRSGVPDVDFRSSVLFDCYFACWCIQRSNDSFLRTRHSWPRLQKIYSYLIDSTCPSPFTYPRLCCVILCSGSGLFPSAQFCHLKNFLVDWCAECCLKQSCFCKDPQTLLSPRPCCLSITASNGRNHWCIS